MKTTTHQTLIITTLIILTLIIQPPTHQQPQLQPQQLTCQNGELLNTPTSVERDQNGNTYIADTLNHNIRRITQNGQITIWGTPGTTGNQDGGHAGLQTGQQAQLNTPTKLHYINNNHGEYLYFTDSQNHQIKKINLANDQITTIAGSTQGNTDGTAQTARLNSPLSLAVIGGQNGNYIYITDTANHALKLLNEAAGTVTTIAGNGQPGSSPTSTTNCANLRFNTPNDLVAGTITTNPNTNIYIADTNNHHITAITHNPQTNTCNGNVVAGNGQPGNNNGLQGTTLQFNQPKGISTATFTNSGTPLIKPKNEDMALWISDSANNQIRYLRINPALQNTNTYALNLIGTGQTGSNEGTTTPLHAPTLQNPPSQNTATFNHPTGITTTQFGTNGHHILIADTLNNIIRTATYNQLNLPGTTSRYYTNPNDILLKLSNPTNAHTQTHTPNNNYPHALCYSDLFPNAEIPRGSRDCRTTPTNPTPTNAIIRLHSQTNSHAETPEQTTPNYNYHCYENLNCRTTQNTCDTTNNEVEIIRLSDTTNAHTELPGQNNYQTRICCTSPPPSTQDILSTEWQTTQGTTIPQNNLLCANNQVTLHTTTTGINGETITFNIIEEDPGSTTQIAQFQNIPITGDQASTTWTITSAQLTQSGEQTGTYRFTTTRTSTGTTLTSYPIRITQNQNLCQGQPPTGTITAPTHRGIYFTNTDITLDNDCTSTNPLTYTWTIQQDNTNTITNNQKSFTHQFTNNGQATITLTCTDTNGHNATSQASILLTDQNTQALAYINKPAYNDIIYNPPQPPIPYASIQTRITYDATDSYVITTTPAQTGSCPTITCTAGNCPTSTENSPQTCTSTIGPPQQTGGALPLINTLTTTTRWANTNFDWTFTDDTTNTNTANNQRSGSTTYTTTSNKQGDKQAQLHFTHSNTNDITTTRTFTLGRCINDGTTFINQDNNQEQPTTGTNAIANACKGIDQTNTDDDCCPTSHSCQSNAQGDHYCQPTGINTCTDYTTQTNCENDQSNVATTSAGGTNNLGQCEYAECYWTNNNTCKARIIKQTSTSGQCTPPLPGSGQPPCVNVQCTYDITESTCTNGQKTLTYTPQPPPTYACSSNTQTCQPDTLTIPCGQNAFELPTYTHWHAILTLTTILTIYALTHRTRKNNTTFKKTNTLTKP